MYTCPNRTNNFYIDRHHTNEAVKLKLLCVIIVFVLDNYSSREFKIKFEISKY